MHKPPKISLEQWLAFTSVVDSGSFAAAAERLNKSQSSISYAVGRLQELLPRPVLRLEGRRAVLTAEGEVLYRYATQLIQQASLTEAVAQAMTVDFEAEVTVALDVLLDIGALCCALEEFSSINPHTRVRILETSLSGTVEALVEKKADIVLGGTVPVGHAAQPLRSVTMLPVAAPFHSLFQSGQDVSELELRRHRQIVLRDTGQRGQKDVGWLQAEQRWTVSHFSSTISLVKAGLGFAFLPRNWIATALQDGSLREIPLEGGYQRVIPLYLMLSHRDTSGPATRDLSSILLRHLQ
ncbi:MAG: hypothetical protein RLZZ385_391 [Pseudomonadota bacterium]|jgi:DNA-binding transcriptional LysR family regulator